MSLIIVADAHITPDSASDKAFFDMLTRLGDSPHDIIFLGDLFDLWIGLPGYEEKQQAAFLNWCREQKQSRTIGFIEGNHEFFIAETHGDNFSWCTSGSSWQDREGYLFVHGDRLNRQDYRYLMFRRLSKNPVTRTLLKYLPGGKPICQRLGQTLQQTNQEYRQGLPKTQIQQYAVRMFNDRLKAIFVGHFHSTYQYEHSPSQILYLVPAWFESGHVTLVDAEDVQRPVSFVHWHTLK